MEYGKGDSFFFKLLFFRLLSLVIKKLNFLIF